MAFSLKSILVDADGVLGGNIFAVPNFVTNENGGI
jgi:hypothetical protein